MNSVIGSLRVNLGIDSAAFTRGMSEAQRAMRQAGQQMQRVGQQMAAVGAGMTVAITAPMVALGRSSMTAANEMNEAMAQIEATLDSTGGAVGRTSDELKSMARALQGVSSYDDADILQNVTSNLLRFANVTGEAFDRAQQVTLDYAAKTGKSLNEVSTLIGRSLNDPVRGLSLLTRAGIDLGDEQEALVRQMAAVGDAAGAQGALLTALNGIYANSAQAARDAAPGSSLIDAWRDLQDTIGQVVVSALGPVTEALASVLGRFNELGPTTKRMAVIFAGVAAALGPVLMVAGGLVAAIGALLPVIAVVAAPLLAIAAAAAAAAVAVGLYVFRDELIPVIQSFAASVAENIGPKLAPLWEALKGAVQAVGQVFALIFGQSDGQSIGATLAVFGDIVSRVFGAALEIITGAINVVTNVLSAFGALLRGDFSAMWGYLGDAVMAVIGAIGRAFQTLFPEVTQWVQRIYEGVREWLVNKLGDIVNWVKEKLGAIADAFKWLWDVVVGNSYVPDLINGIQVEFARLDDVMVNPALAANDDVAASFRGLGRSVESTLDGIMRSLSSRDWRGAASGLLDILGQGGGRFSGIARVGSAIMSALPGFNTGGSFTVGGQAGIDKNLVAFRASRGEMVDIRRPGQARGGGDLDIQIGLNANDEWVNAKILSVSGPHAERVAVTATAGLARKMAQRSANRL